MMNPDEEIIADRIRSGRNRHFFPLTGLQIGDLKSYLSRLTIFLALESKKLFILVDNQPWSIGQDAQPAHLWQFMVTKSRDSPFANSRARRRTKDCGRTDFRNLSESDARKPKQLYRWFSLIKAALHRKRSLPPMKKLKNSLLLNSDLHHTLYGYIVFEVSWDQVRGINYFNELQTDTSMALEVKIMSRWEFDNTSQASRSISSWFSGTSYERKLLQAYLHGISVRGDVFSDALSDTNGANKETTDDFGASPRKPFCCDDTSSFPGADHGTSSFETPRPHGAYKRRKIIKFMSAGTDPEESSSDIYSEVVRSPSYSLDSRTSSDSDNETADLCFEVTHYKDILILLRFDDPDLPFYLKKIIVSDLKLLTLLEYGLPSWVIFLQSYPVFCHIYRPWMCPLARALYFLVSFATVLIAFYDLYKNVPVLKVTAARLCGPLFEWVESWEMISRIRYLGTMLFLHNFEKAVAWFLMTTRGIRSLLAIVTEPLAGPIMEVVEFLLPSWNIILEIVEMLSSVIFSLVGSTYDVVLNLAHIIIWPVWFLISVILNIATSVIQPILWMFLKILISPVNLAIALADFIAMICTHIFYFLQYSWSTVGSLLSLASATKIPAETHQLSLWRSLWNDIFSQVFRAIRSILYGFIAFFAACNRHRLSIYNYLREFLRFSRASDRSKHATANNLSKTKPSAGASNAVREKSWQRTERR